MIQRLAETVWRRLRLFHAQACWEADRVKRVFTSASKATKLTVQETELRADALVLLLNEFDPLFRENSKLQSRIEYLLRGLMKKRSGGAIRYKAFCPRRDPELEEMERELQSEMAVSVCEAMSPKQRAELWETLKQRAAKKNTTQDSEG